MTPLEIALIILCTLLLAIILFLWRRLRDYDATLYYVENIVRILQKKLDSKNKEVDK